MYDNKNLILAITLSLIVLFGWGYLAEYMGWVQPPKPPAESAGENRTPPPPVQAPAEESPPLPAFTPAPGRDFTVETPLYKAVFYTGGAYLRSFILQKYRAGIEPDSPLVNMVNDKAAAFAPLGLVINSQPSWSTGQWAFADEAQTLSVTSESQSFTITGLTDNLRINRTFTINPDTYLIREKITVTNAGEQARTARLAWTCAMDKNLSSGGQYDSLRIAWDLNGSLDTESSEKDLEKSGVQVSGKVYWAGPMSTYFLSAAMPANPDDKTVKGRLVNGIYRTSLENTEFLLNPGQSQELEVSYWIGPKERAMLDAVSDQLAKSIDLGWFSWIGRALIYLLEFFHSFVHNWGIAIILLTILIKILFWPLTAKSYSSMEKMKQLQPMMLAIREKYKDDKEKMNKEVMGLYKTYGVNPASGCVPILVQMPVFFGLYQALLSSLALRHASFLTYFPGTDVIWLADLSAKDPLYITPIVMGLTMFLQQKLSPAPADPIQQKVMLFLPLIFTVLFLNFPSGLVLYWLVNNILSIFQQWLGMKRAKKIRIKPVNPQPDTGNDADGKVIEARATPKKGKAGRKQNPANRK